MNSSEFHYISQLLKRRSGLALTEEKIYLLEARLLPIARVAGCKDLPEFIHTLRERGDEKIIAEVVDAMTTNESMFFRDRRPFEQLRRVVLPRLCAAQPARKLRIWSAACASGQEPYSLAMSLLEEQARMGNMPYEIIASDISQRVVAKAERGIYTQFEVQRGLPIAMLLKYFTQLPDHNWQANDELRKKVTFRAQNLLGNLAPLGLFDIVFCRNVLLYFDDATKAATLGRLADMLTPQGILVMGSAETTLGYSARFKALDNEQGLYVLSGQ